jgi:hypothetical protein
MSRTSRARATTVTTTTSTSSQAQLTAALERMSDQLARATGWPDAHTRHAALRRLEALGDSYVSSQIAHGRAVRSADELLTVLLTALADEAQTTPGARGTEPRLRELAGVAARRSFASYERRLVHLRQLAQLGDVGAGERVSAIAADVHRQTDADREALQIKNAQDYAALYGGTTTDAAAQERAEELEPA